MTENNTSITFVMFVNLMCCANQCLEGKTYGSMFCSIITSLGHTVKSGKHGSLRTQMHEAILQVSAYAANNGFRYGMISNGLWSWVFLNDGCNNMSLSQAFRYDATNPTVLEVCCCQCPYVGIRSHVFLHVDT